jgi:hypothetical protein
MRVRHKVLVSIDEGTDGKNMLLLPDDTAAEVILDGPQEASVTRAVLAASGMFSVPFGTVADARGVYLKASGDFTVSVNGGAALPVQRGVASSSGGAKAATTKFFFEGLITAVDIVATEALTLTAAIWGDPAP